MKQIIGTLCILTITINTLFGQLEVPYKENEIPIHSVKKITGYFGERIDANREGSIKGFDIDKYIAMVEIKKHKDWWWIGEQPGKWLESAVLSSAQSNDTTLLIKAKRYLNVWKRLRSQADIWASLIHRYELLSNHSEGWMPTSSILCCMD